MDRYSVNMEKCWRNVWNKICRDMQRYTEMETSGKHVENNWNIHQMEAINDVQLGTGLAK
jgi:hypothetical protein